jgi:hypothetical protein
VSKSERSFSVDYDRAIARLRVGGNEKLAAHLERLRPNLSLQDNDTGLVFAGAANQFAADFYAIAKELHADPFDVLLMLSGMCAQTLNMLQRDGLDFAMGMYAFIKHMESVAKRIEEAVQSGEIETYER